MKKITTRPNYYLSTKLVGLSCVDGSPGGYYVSLAEEGSDTWLFFQQGGGWCYDFERFAMTFKSNYGKISILAKHDTSFQRPQ